MMSRDESDFEWTLEIFLFATCCTTTNNDDDDDYNGQWPQWTTAKMDNDRKGWGLTTTTATPLMRRFFCMFLFLLLPAVFFRHNALVFQHLPHFDDDGHKHDDRGQRRDETHNKKNTQEMSYDVSWASSMFFFLSFLFFFILLTLFF